MTTFHLPIARYRFDIVALTPIRLPDYAGSLLRGAFGHALRQVACITRAKDCAPCPLKAGCPYTSVFAPGRAVTNDDKRTGLDIPAPYVIEPPAWGLRVVDPGQTFTFHMVLIGRAIEHLPIITLAWQRALAKGLGAGDGTGNLLRVVNDDAQTTYSAVDDVIKKISVITSNDGVSPAPTEAPTDESALQQVTLHFQTPLRLQQNGHALAPHRLTPRALVMAAARRSALLGKFHGNGEPQIGWTQLTIEANGMTDQHQLEWRDWTRFSSKQKTTMQLGGVVGKWTLTGNMVQALPWLKLGQMLHIGKETVFGLGQYHLEYLTVPPKSGSIEKTCEPTRQFIERKEKTT